MKIRHQLPAYSPVTANASLLAIAQALHLGDDPRPQLRALLEREYDAKSVLLCGSGTQALTIAIREARKRTAPASPVALPAFSCFDVATAAVGANARIMLYDLDPDTLAPDVESLERVLRAGAGIVVIAPLYGLPVDWAELSALVERYGAVLIEDAAQGNGATWKGRRLGAVGEISTLSFSRGKGWTGGNGGAVLFRSRFGGNVSRVRDSNIVRDTGTALSVGVQWALGRPGLYGIPLSVPGLGLGETTYRPPARERSISRSAAAVLLATKDSADREANVRRAHAKQLLDRIQQTSGVTTIRAQRSGEAGYLRLPLRLPSGMAVFRSQRSARRLGIAPSYPRALNELPEVAPRIHGSELEWPGARALVRELVTLPTHSRLLSEDLAQIADILLTLGGSARLPHRNARF